MQGGKHMARYDNELDDERDYYSRREGLRREDWGYGDRFSRGRNAIDEYRRPEYRRGRFGERADYEYNEPRYFGPYREERYGDSRFERGEHLRRGFAEPRLERSRLRCHEIMTRDLVVATRDTTLREVTIMMKEEDTGVIPVVEHEVAGGNGKTTQDEKLHDTRNYNRGKLVGLITDRDIVVRAVAENRDPTTTRAEEIMSTDLYTAKPNDRVVDVIRKMGDKQVRRIPVVSDSGRLLGMISMADIARETQDDRELAQALEEISQESSFWRRLFG
jgi:CBS domain-containing protein